MNQVVVESELINKTFTTRVIAVSFPKEFKDLGVLSIRKFYLMALYTLKLVKELMFFRPDLVYFTLSPANIALYRDVFYAAVIKLFRGNLLYHLHGKGIKENAGKNKLLYRIYKFAFKNSSIICLSELITDDISDVYSGIPYAVNYGIQDVYEKYKKDEPESGGKKVTILFLSNYVENKGVFDIIDALKLLSDEGYDFQARLVGSPGSISVNDLDEYVNEKKLSDKVLIVGPKYGEDKYREYYRADLFVFPTHFESFGLVALEAMQFALPIIASQEGSLPIIVDDGQTGFLVSKRDITALRDKMKLLMEDKDLRIAMGKRGREKFLKKFTRDTFEKNMLKVFNHCVETPHGRNNG